ncbi:SEC-C metal-binding domain-containing protein [Desulfotignum balticum]|uniref:SEC-C metal-binding domain-containing protein n=1 Tax=Desulfotignum balticum TaxID=115781 RepID=UPI000413C929|nr:SEC-C metal-binding domain-containing protein [Desulfotignum balticum]
MDTSGHIEAITDKEAKQLLEDGGLENKIPLDDKQAHVLKRRSLRYRKNWMRNKPCVCGSGKKFKKCCWSKVTMAKKEE